MAPKSVATPELDVQGIMESVAEAYYEQSEAFDALSKSKLVISLIGDANVGKSATVNALTGTKLSSVHPISGWTKRIALYPYGTNVYIADTPGLHDTSTPELAQKAHEFVEKDADIILFFVNAASNRSREEAESFRAVLRLGKPTIVVLNKIDTIWSEERQTPRKAEMMLTHVERDQARLRDRIQASVRRAFGLNTKEQEPEPQEETLPTAVPTIPAQVEQVVVDLRRRLDYDVIIPISATRGTNIALLSSTIADILNERGKDLLFLKVSRYKTEQVKKWISAATAGAAAIGALPIPGSDILPLTSLQVALCLRIAYIYDCKVGKGDVMKLISSTVTGVVGRSLFRVTLKAIGAFSTVGAVVTSSVAAFVAAAITYGLGWAANAYYKSGQTLSLGAVGEIYKDAFKGYAENKNSQ